MLGARLVGARLVGARRASAAGSGRLRGGALNALDVAVGVALLGAMVGGWYRGLITRVAVWAGVIVGGLLAARNVGAVLNALSLDGDGRGQRIGAGAAVVIGAMVLGRIVGGLVGRAIHRRLPGRVLRGADRTAGAGLGALGVLTVVWLATPVLQLVPGWSNEQARSSLIAGAVERVTPTPPNPLIDAFDVVGSLGVVNDLIPTAAALTEGGSALDVVSSARRAATSRGGGAQPTVVALEHESCGRTLSAAGVVVGARRVLTTATAVRGIGELRVRLAVGWVPDRGDRSVLEGQLTGRVVAVDIFRDLAVVEVPEGWSVPSAASVDSGAGTTVIRPPFRRSAAASASWGTLRRAVLEGGHGRRVRVLGVSLGQADIGAPVVDGDHTVVGLVRAVSADQPEAEAIDGTELVAFLAKPPLTANRPAC